jgi:magnesium transporter
MARDFRAPFRPLLPRAKPVKAQPGEPAAGPLDPARSSLIDNAIYEAGRRVESPASLRDTYAALDAHPDSMAWIGLYRPSTEELNSLAEQFDLHELAIEDAILAHQRPKIERYGTTLFVVLRAAQYLDDS